MTDTKATDTNTTMTVPKKPAGLIARFADRYHVDPQKLLATLKATAFRQRGDVEITNEDMMALLVVADQYKLNPFTKEIYAYPDKSGGIVPVVGVDGWSRIINSDPAFDGMEFVYSDAIITDLPGQTHPAHEWIECIMYRKDRDKPITVREYLDEVYREPIKKRGSNGPYVIAGPWQTHTRRLHRHKTMIQTARVAFGYTGIYDEDEAERIIERDVTPITPITPRVQTGGEAATRTESVAGKLAQKVPDTLDGAPVGYGDVPVGQEPYCGEGGGDQND